MQPIPLRATDNQRFQILLDGQQYDVTLRTIPSGLMLADIKINGAMAIQGTPVYTGWWLIPYRYLEGAGGNFVFNTASGDDPVPVNLGISDNLFYFAAADIAAQRAAQ